MAKSDLLHMYFHIPGDYLQGQFLEVGLLSQRMQTYVVLLDVVISSLGCSLAPTTDLLLLQRPPGCPTIHFDFDTNYLQAAQTP